MANRGLLPSPLSRGGATGAGHPPEGEREGEPLTGARAGSARARARATRASALSVGREARIRWAFTPIFTLQIKYWPP